MRALVGVLGVACAAVQADVLWDQSFFRVPPYDPAEPMMPNLEAGNPPPYESGPFDARYVVDDIDTDGAAWIVQKVTVWFTRLERTPLADVTFAQLNFWPRRDDETVPPPDRLPPLGKPGEVAEVVSVSMTPELIQGLEAWRVTADGLNFPLDPALAPEGEWWAGLTPIIEEPYPDDILPGLGLWDWHIPVQLPHPRSEVNGAMRRISGARGGTMWSQWQDPPGSTPYRNISIVIEGIPEPGTILLLLCGTVCRYRRGPRGA